MKYPSSKNPGTQLLLRQYVICSYGNCDKFLISFYTQNIWNRYRGVLVSSPKVTKQLIFCYSPLSEYEIFHFILYRPLLEYSMIFHLSNWANANAHPHRKYIYDGITKITKSCFRCKKNTWHDESDCIFQSPKYLIIIVNWFRYINNNVFKDMCSIPVDMTIVPEGYHRSSRTVYVFWSLYYHCRQHKITDFEIIGTKFSSITHVVMYELVIWCFLD